MRKKLRDFYLLTFSKKWVSRLMFIAIVDLQLSYILAFLDKVQIAETLSVTIVTEIIGVMLGYFAKAFFETREEENLKYKREQDNKQVLFLEDEEPDEYEEVNEEEAKG